MKHAIPSQVLVVNENGDNIIEKEEGKEIQYTKDYGCGVDVLSDMPDKTSRSRPS